MDSSSQNEDIDVSNECERVLSGGADDDVMRIENLTKVHNVDLAKRLPIYYPLLTGKVLHKRFLIHFCFSYRFTIHERRVNI